MWLPETVYKSLPTVYALMGALFIIGVFYLGLDAPMSPVYLGLGLVSILASITVTIWRSKHSGKMQRADSDDDQTN
jgi:multisubunit Na+/H+ antiporter MnhC subunit